MVKIKIADIPIGINNKFEFVERFCADFLTDEAPLFTVSATEADLAEEQEIAEGGIKYPDDYLESIVVYRKIAEQLYKYDALVFHGAVIETGGKAYAVTANSGVGKTTHVRLWLKEFGEAVRVLNGDKPILRIIDGVVYACGTPWRGKENYGVNAMRPLCGIAFLSRGEKNLVRETKAEAIVVRLMNQIYLAKNNVVSLTSTMRIADSVLKSVPLFELECNMDPEAARVAYAALVCKNNNDGENQL